jgi:hypothetical protein
LRASNGSRSPATTSGDPDAGDKERATAVADWKAWVEGLVGKNGVGKHTGPVKK